MIVNIGDVVQVHFTDHSQGDCKGLCFTTATGTVVQLPSISNCHELVLTNWEVEKGNNIANNDEFMSIDARCLYEVVLFKDIEYINDPAKLKKFANGTLTKKNVD